MATNKQPLVLETYHVGRLSIGNNPFISFRLRGMLNEIRAFRQGGGLDFWAFPERLALSREDQAALDSELNTIWAKAGAA